jgi:hypothetical protein
VSTPWFAKTSIKICAPVSFIASSSFPFKSQEASSGPAEFAPPAHAQEPAKQPKKENPAALAARLSKHMEPSSLNPPRTTQNSITVNKDDNALNNDDAPGGR